MAVPGHRLDRMFNPKTVVVIGDKGPNFMWLKNSLAFRESGGEIYSVQLDPKEIEGIEKLGVKNFLSLEEVPGEIDYALVAVPRPIAPLILKGLIANNVQVAGFFTSGFAETGEEEGIKLQEQLTEMAREANFALVALTAWASICLRSVSASTETCLLPRTAGSGSCRSRGRTPSGSRS